jgi:hypothetical protein
LPTRRQFLQVGAAGAALLVVARMLERPVATAPSYRVLDGGSASIIAALVPVVLAGALPTTSPQREGAAREVVEAFDRAVSGLSPAVRGEIDDLLGVLRFGPTRWLLTGLASPLGEASPADVAAFLTRWRSSRFDLLRAGYQALTQLIAAAWYDNPSAWPAIGYPGPPALR